MFVEFVSLGDPSRRMFDDGAGMHEYLLCTCYRHNLAGPEGGP
jgi:hypothetical protein